MKLSGLLRLRDEATWCAIAIESFLPWLDELVVAVQPSTDGTREIVARWAGDPKVTIMDWPAVCSPAGEKPPEDDPRSITGFYNAVLARATGTHGVKLDGDLVMMDWAGAEIRRRVEAGYDRVKLYGTDLVGDLRHVGCHPHCPTDGVFKFGPDVRYVDSEWSCRLAGAGGATTTIAKPAFLHFKWTKPVESAIKRWPEDWRDHERWRAIYERRLPVAPYTGEYPSSVKALVNAVWSSDA